MISRRSQTKVYPKMEKFMLNLMIGTFMQGAVKTQSIETLTQAGTGTKDLQDEATAMIISMITALEKSLLRVPGGMIIGEASKEERRGEGEVWQTEIGETSQTKSPRDDEIRDTRTSVQSMMIGDPEGAHPTINVEEIAGKRLYRKSVTTHTIIMTVLGATNMSDAGETTVIMKGVGEGRGDTMEMSSTFLNEGALP